MAASQREKSSAQSNADRVATQHERNKTRNAGTGVSFLRSKLKVRGGFGSTTGSSTAKVNKN